VCCVLCVVCEGKRSCCTVAARQTKVPKVPKEINIRTVEPSNRRTVAAEDLEGSRNRMDEVKRTRDGDHLNEGFLIYDMMYVTQKY
jgi:hypothetical protein